MKKLDTSTIHANTLVNFGECENDSNVREIMLAARTILVNPKLLSRVRIRTRSRFCRAEINPADSWSWSAELINSIKITYGFSRCRHVSCKHRSATASHRFFFQITAFGPDGWLYNATQAFISRPVPRLWIPLTNYIGICERYCLFATYSLPIERRIDFFFLATLKQNATLSCLYCLSLEKTKKKQKKFAPLLALWNRGRLNLRSI